MIGRGYAFSQDWTMDDTYSFLIEGTLDGDAEKEMFDAGQQASLQASLDLAQCSEV